MLKKEKGISLIILIITIFILVVAVVVGIILINGKKNGQDSEHAFMNCVNLSEITFINNVTDLADNAFTGCTKWNANH